MGIDLCAFKAAVAKEPLDMLQRHPRLQQMGGNTVAQGMQTDRFL